MIKKLSIAALLVLIALFATLAVGGLASASSGRQLFVSTQTAGSGPPRIAVDSSGDYYLSFESFPGISLAKYDSAGRRQWIRRFHSGGDAVDKGGVVLDDRGNVYLVGYSEWATEPETSRFLTIKYTAAGERRWVRRYKGPINKAAAAAAAFDSAGNIYVYGTTFLALEPKPALALVKYAPSGRRLWVKTYQAADSHTPVGIAIDSKDNVVLSAATYENGTGYDYQILKYSGSGKRRWSRRYDGPAGKSDDPRGLGIDAADNIYVTGVSDGRRYPQIATVKYGPSGRLKWVERYKGPTGWAEPSGMAVKPGGGVYVAGIVRVPPKGAAPTDSDFVTISYAPSGTRGWVRRLDGSGDETKPLGQEDRVSGIALDKLGNVIVTGSTLRTGGRGLDYTTIKYDSLGKVSWLRYYDGQGKDKIADVNAVGYNEDLTDEAMGVGVDDGNNVYVTGTSYQRGGAMKITTVKYAP
jgi:hypothetical protein